MVTKRKHEDAERKKLKVILFTCGIALAGLIVSSIYLITISQDNTDYTPPIVIVNDRPQASK